MHDPYTPPRSEPAAPKDSDVEPSGTQKFLFTAFTVLFLSAIFSLGTAYESVSAAVKTILYALVSGYFAAILPFDRARYFLPLSILLGLIIGTIATLFIEVVLRYQ